MLHKYDLQQDTASLDPLQRLREAMTYWNVSDRLNLFHNFFSPGYLFVTGGSNLNNSTRQAGVFLAPLAALIAVGIYESIVRPTESRLILLLGFLTAPVAALVVLENYAIDRELALLPFGVMLAAVGAERLWSAPLGTFWLPLWRTIGASGLAVGSGYGLLTLVQHGRIGRGAATLAAAAAAMLIIDSLLRATRSWRPIAGTLLLMVPLQFSLFYHDYQTDYPVRAAGWFGHNIRGATEALMLEDAKELAPVIYLNTSEVPYVRNYWNLYLRQRGKEALFDRSVMFEWQHLGLEGMTTRGIVLTTMGDPVAASLAASGALELLSTASDPVEPYSRTAQQYEKSFAVYRVRQGARPN